MSRFTNLTLPYMVRILTHRAAHCAVGRVHGYLSRYIEKASTRTEPQVRQERRTCLVVQDLAQHRALRRVAVALGAEDRQDAAGPGVPHRLQQPVDGATKGIPQCSAACRRIHNRSPAATCLALLTDAAETPAALDVHNDLQRGVLPSTN
jgi:hypothetical protein